MVPAGLQEVAGLSRIEGAHLGARLGRRVEGPQGTVGNQLPFDGLVEGPAQDGVDERSGPLAHIGVEDLLDMVGPQVGEFDAANEGQDVIATQLGILAVSGRRPMAAVEIQPIGKVTVQGEIVSVGDQAGGLASLGLPQPDLAFPARFGIFGEPFALNR